MCAILIVRKQTNRKEPTMILTPLASWALFGLLAFTSFAVGNYLASLDNSDGGEER